MNGLSLFSGIGGLDLALSEWVRPVAYCEADRYAQAVLLSRMREGQLAAGPIWPDVRTLRGDHLPRIEILYGGFPCQDLSAAGAGAGLAGERSGLYFELERLVRETKPAFVFLENVPAIRTRGLGRVVWGLSELGYDCRWTVVSAAEVGGSFIGKRWFLLAKANSGKSRRKVSAASDSEALWFEQRRSEGTHGRSSALNPPTGIERFATWSPEGGFESQVFGVGNGIPYAVDRDRCLGNGAPPPQAREAFMRLSGLREG